MIYSPLNMTHFGAFIDQVFTVNYFNYLYMGRADSTVPFYCIQRSIAYNGILVYHVFSNGIFHLLFFPIFVCCHPINHFKRFWFPSDYAYLLLYIYASADQHLCSLIELQVEF